MKRGIVTAHCPDNGEEAHYECPSRRPFGAVLDVDPYCAVVIESDLLVTAAAFADKKHTLWTIDSSNRQPDNKDHKDEQVYNCTDDVDVPEEFG
jgi:hypothetical protein